MHTDKSLAKPHQTKAGVFGRGLGSLIYRLFSLLPLLSIRNALFGFPHYNMTFLFGRT